ncbi:MAG: hypothetical protein K2X60_11305 [Xanthobacteraceae bacterium]|nr:hypothetical protein [Xanthobacteraceae bacterium]
MLQKMIEDIKDSTGMAIRLTSFALGVAVCSFVTLGFLCAAAFVYALDRYGLFNACLAGAAVFFTATLLVAICYAVGKRRARRKPVEEEKSALHIALSDPMVLAVGLQVMRSVGVKRLIPLLAIGGVAFGLMSQRHRSSEPDQGE